jgi:hypothetical protein
MTKETGQCECFGDSGLCASTHVPDTKTGVVCCDLCGWPIKNGSFNGLREQIRWWKRQSRKYRNEIGFVALGVVHGLQLAKADYGAKDDAALVARGADDEVPPGIA